MIRRMLAIASLFVVAAPASAEECFIKRAEATVCPVFQPIGPDLVVRAISGDGRTLVGSEFLGGLRNRAVRWVDGVKREIPGLEAFDDSALATAVSRDGSVIAGPALDRPSGRSVIYRWESGEVVLMEASPLNYPWPIEMSGDGNVVIFEWDLQGGRWTPERGFEPWRTPQGDDITTSGVSNSGKRIVGTEVRPGEPWTPWEWVGDRAEPLLDPALLASLGYASAHGISPDGGIVVGSAYERSDRVGLLWNEEGFQLRPFPLLEATWEGRFLSGQAPDGAALVDGLSGEAFLFSDVLARLGIDTPALRGVHMSYDGHSIFGTDGERWIRAIIAPKLGIDVEPGSRSNRIDLSKRRKITVRVYGSEQADASDIDPADVRFGPGRAKPVAAKRPRDRNGDGWLDRDYRFDPADVELALGDREVCLAGVANGLPFRVCSEVRTRFGGEGEAR